MRILILSDLHNEFAVFEPPRLTVDLVVLTGDIDVGVEGANWALENFNYTPIIYVAGNHEYYGHELPGINEQLSKLSEQKSNFFFLENQAIILENIKFLGCTLWSDFLLFGAENFQLACQRAEQSISDFFQIRLGVSDSYRKFRATDVVRLHQRSIAFLEAHLSEKSSDRTVVVTHHAPTMKSISDRYRSDLLSCAFVSDLEWLIRHYKPDFWIHGHTHFNVDYIFDKTRIISNQRGYFPFELSMNFKKNLIVEIT